MYNDKILALFQNPPNVGRILKADGVGEVGNASCGDILKIYIKVTGEKIVDAKFQTFGCATAIAASSIACTMLVGRTVDGALEIKNADILKEMGEIPAQKIHCSVLAQEAIAAAIADYHKNQEKLNKK